MTKLASEGPNGQDLGDILGHIRPTAKVDDVAAASPAANPAFKPEVAIDFLKKIDADGWHNLVAIDPLKRTPLEGRTFAPGQWDAMCDWVAARAGRRNIYFSVNEPRPDAPDAKLSKGDITAIRALYLDLDPPGEAPLDEERAEIAAKVESLRTMPLPPTIVLDSGGGAQVFWQLDQKIDAGTAETWAEDKGKALAGHLGGDRSVNNVDRIMRLPGTLNIPDAGKLAKGRVERMASVMHVWGKRHSPADFDREIAPSAAQRLEGKAPAHPDLICDIDLVRRALAAMPNTAENFPTYHEWFPVCVAIRAATANDPEAGRELWDEWSARWPSYDAEETAQKWNSLADATTFQFGAEWLMRKARAIGGDEGAAVYGSYVVSKNFEPPSNGFDFDRATRLSAKRLADIPARRFVLGTRFQPGALTIGVGAPGVSKSTFAMLSALAIAAGRPLTQEHVFRPGPVLIYNAEDPLDEMLRRLKAIAAYHDVDPRVFLDRVRLLSGYDQRRLAFAVRKERNGVIAPGGDVEEFATFVASAGIVHVVLDPFISLHRGLEENSSSDMEQLGDYLRAFARKSGASVDLIHHTVKDRKAGTEGNAGVADASRGSGAVMGFVRAAYTLSPMSKATGDELRLPADRAAQMVRLDDAKRNYTRRSATERWFELKSVLDTGEIVPGSEFGSPDVTRVTRALSSVGVHAPFDAHTQRALALVETSDDAERRLAGTRDYIVGRMTEDRASRTEIVARMMADLDVSDTTARTRIDEAAPEGRKNAKDAFGDGLNYRIWREQRRRKWTVCREVTGQHVPSGSVFE